MRPVKAFHQCINPSRQRVGRAEVAGKALNTPPTGGRPGEPLGGQLGNIDQTLPCAQPSAGNSASENPPYSGPCVSVVPSLLICPLVVRNKDFL